MELRIILFIVKVPVLSTHRTVAEPSVSIAGIRLARTFLFDMRHAPIPRNITSTTENSSGINAMLRPRPASIPFSHSPRVYPYMIATNMHSINPPIAKLRTTDLVSFFSRVSSWEIVSRAFPILPISVFAPVAVILAIPCPWTTRVPE